MSETNEPIKPKRKYVKKTKMLLRSNNDYIDHTYWPKMLALSEQKHKNMMAKYGAKPINSLSEPEISEQERKALREMGIGKHHTVPTNPPMKRISGLEQ